MGIYSSHLITVLLKKALQNKEYKVCRSCGNARALLSRELAGRTVIEPLLSVYAVIGFPELLPNSTAGALEEDPMAGNSRLYAVSPGGPGGVGRSGARARDREVQARLGQ